MFPLSLASWKYRNIENGPIDRIRFRESHLFDHTPVMYAFVYLKSGLSPESKNLIYGHADGNGTHVTKLGAVYRGISEALERWAFHHVSGSAEAEKFAFHVDRSTTGMAAFPGLNARTARTFAHWEAIERWNVIQWWGERLSHRKLNLSPEHGISGIEIESLWPNAATVVLWAHVPHTALTAYGFAAQATPEKAINKALVELSRNARVLKLFTQSSLEIDSDNRQERRLVFFAKEKGSDVFHRRVNKAVTACKARPETMIDSEIAGPWSQFAFVWRCLFRSEIDTEEGDEFFLF